jgi:hypothetical protein
MFLAEKDNNYSFLYIKGSTNFAGQESYLNVEILKVAEYILFFEVDCAKDTDSKNLLLNMNYEGSSTAELSKNKDFMDDHQKYNIMNSLNKGIISQYARGPIDGIQFVKE